MLGAGYALLAHRASGLDTPDSLSALVAVTPLVTLAFAMAWRASHRAPLVALCVAGCAALYGARTWLLNHYHWVFLLEHAGVYALLCLAFGKTLRTGRTPMVTGFARIVHATMSPALTSYTRSLTWVWCIYFGSISALSLLLFWLAPLTVWSAFANLLGLPLLVLMFAGEYAVRCWVLPPEDRAGPLEAIRAYRQASSSGSAHRT